MAIGRQIPVTRKDGGAQPRSFNANRGGGNPHPAYAQVGALTYTLD
ncbi:MAG TPA: hypothetical protein VHY20_03325 [Pirellulales bacterium]|nr:hypothetical protein [Pirellulales bacterium]